MHYFLLIGGMIVMCVPEDASLLRFAIQGIIGLSMFVSGVAIVLEKND